MRYLNNRQYTLIGVAVLFIISVAVMTQNRYSVSLKDLSQYIESLDIGIESSKKGPATLPGKITDNNDPDKIREHTIENKVNELLKKKIIEELQYERDEMAKKSKEYEDKTVKFQKEVDEAKQAAESKVKIAQEELEKAQKEIKTLKGGPVSVETTRIKSTSPEYVKHTYSFKSKDEKYDYDPTKNELIILSSINTFGPDRTFVDFFEMLDGLDFKKSKTSVAFLVGSEEMFESIDKHVSDVFKNIKDTQDLAGLSESYPRVTLIHAKFLESEFQIGRADRQNKKVQKERRKILSRMRNFLVTNGIEDERHSLYLDSDIIHLPKNLMTVLLESKKDIATIQIDMMADGRSVHVDYDLNSWAGERKAPTPEEEENLKKDPDYIFIPGPGENAIFFKDLSSNLEKYGLTDDPGSAYELKSVGGGVLYALSEVYKQGVLFPPYYSIGTTWDRSEGWDGVETEGLCYIANSIGYKCWGFPNLKGGHTTGL